MKTSPLYLKLNNCAKKIVICQGGGDAGKTVAILQRMAIRRILRKNTLGTVSSQTIPAAKAGALRSFQLYVASDPEIAKYISKYNETERTYTFYNRSKLEFKSYQDELAATGSERDDLFVNECNHESYQTFWQLQRKSRGQIFLDYNPTSPFWVHEKLMEIGIDGKPNPGFDRQYFNKVQMYITDHRHNIFLSKEDHEAYENITDPDLFRVYSRGFTGMIKGLIFGHFRKYGSIYLPDKDVQRYFWGLDYGYTNDPTAIMKVAVQGRKRIGKEYGYEAGMPAETIKNILVSNGWAAGQRIYSEADPNMINQLRILGLPAEPAIKGPGSKAAGISKVKEHECYYTDDSLKFEKEIGVYKWMTAQDVVTGKEVMTNVPIDGWDHLCDAFRMGDYTDSFRYR